LSSPTFDRSVFINCPFDKNFAPLLEAIAFCVIYMGFFPRLAPENRDNSVPRLDRIIALIKGSKYSIHDLSRCRSTRKNEYYRMNMPFELGLDHACKKFGRGQLSQKVILILEQDQYDYQKSLSDISGWDIHHHEGKFEKAVSHVRAWLIAQAHDDKVGAKLILGKYIAFQEWLWESELASGASEDEIRAYPTIDKICAMQRWMHADQPN
jgi:hypothetical protein